MGFWLLTVLLVVLAASGGFALGRYWAPSAERVRELEEALERSRGDHDAYRAQVEAHFQRTAALFNDLTGTYRSLYEHLADGAQSLAARPAELRGDVPERRLGADTDADPQASAKSAAPTEPGSAAADIGSGPAEEAGESPGRTEHTGEAPSSGHPAEEERAAPAAEAANEPEDAAEDRGAAARRAGV